MSKTTRSIAALLVLLLLLTMGVVIFRTKPLGNSEAVSARLGLENASMTERWITVDQIPGPGLNPVTGKEEYPVVGSGFEVHVIDPIDKK